MVGGSVLVLLLVAQAGAVAPPADVASVALVESIESVNCDINTYYWGVYDSHHYCVKCPDERTSPGCVDCAPDGDATLCTSSDNTCTAGHYNDLGTCTRCPKGKWQNEAGMDECQTCPMGMFQPDTGKHSCYWCPVGQYRESPGGEECAKCDACAKGQYGVTTAHGMTTQAACSCDTCQPGTYAPAGYTMCFNCPKGRFQDQPGEYSCYYCPMGKYEDLDTSATCKSCPAGQTTSAHGITDEQHCDVTADEHTGCQLGQYKLVEASTQAITCEACPAGKFAHMADADYGGHCYSCPDGYQQSALGETSCSTCPDGKFPSTDHTSCDAPTIYSVEFQMYDFAKAADVVEEGWHLMSYDEVQEKTFQNLLNAAYETNGKGLPVLDDWSGPGCCVTMAENYRLTANGLSFVYPVDASGTALKCNGTETYSNGDILRLVWHGGATNGLQELDTAATLYGAEGEGSLCAPQANDASPGLFVRKRVVQNSYELTTTCEHKNGHQYCLKKFATDAPSVAPTVEPPMHANCPPPACDIQESQFCTIVHDNVTNADGCPLHPCGHLECTAVDCVVGAWETWDTCSVSCGTGFQSRERTVEQQAQHGGTACPMLVDDRNCETHCPMQCVVSNWTVWGACSVTCGTGQENRSRFVEEEAQDGGACDKQLSDSQSCNLGICPTDGPTKAPTKAPTNAPTLAPTATPTVPPTSGTHVEVELQTNSPTVPPTLSPTQLPSLSPTASPTHDPMQCVWEWSKWTICNKQCGSGQQTRIRVIISEAMFGGQSCPADDIETQNCNVDPCPIDCVLDDWEEWEPCSETCGLGQHTRSKPILQEPLFGGIQCAEHVQHASCIVASCPVDCEVGDWQSWDTCSAQCGAGHHERNKRITTASAHGGIACPEADDLTEQRSCFEQACPEDCAVGVWTEWSDCSVTCDNGEWHRTREITTPQGAGGVPCPDTNETEICAMEACPAPQDCLHSEWSAWSPCSLTCGLGQQVREREVRVEAANGGSPCGALMQEQSCDDRACPVDCQMSSWSNWTACTKSCGDGAIKRRHRYVVTNHEYNGVQCSHEQDVSTCATEACPVDCIMSDFGDRSDCSVTCGDGTQTSSRETLLNASYGGVACGNSIESHTCQGNSECPVDCSMSGWGNWSECTRTCDTGYTMRERTVLTQAAEGGVQCPSITETIDCGTVLCPIDCIAGAWGTFQDCTATCGSGTQTRTKIVSQHPAHGGSVCPAVFEELTCNPEPCAEDCDVGDWTEFTPCSRTCGEGHKARTRQVEVMPESGGVVCPELSEDVSCNPDPCPVDCELAAWGQYADCSVTCGPGVRKRTRAVSVTPMNGGVDCPATEEIAECDEGICPSHCAVTAWTQWSGCHMTCGSSQRSRTREVTYHANSGLYSCPHLAESDSCGLPACPVDCTVGSWTGWSECSMTCSGGKKARSREISVESRDGGMCPPLTQEEQCNQHVPCPGNCVLGDWSPYSGCTSTCGSGTKYRTREVLEMPDYGACPALSVTSDCGNAACPTDCAVSGWSDWTKCGITENRPCGKGKFRQVLTMVTNGGTPCPELADWEDCAFSECAAANPANNNGPDGCSHVTCNYHIANTGHSTIRVNHNGDEENGDWHHCKRVDGICSCACHDRPVSETNE